MRLAFAVATAVLPDVVILDEALAVGDGRFQKKCVDRIFELKASGRTIFFCSHAMYYVSTLCDEAIWLRERRGRGGGRRAEGRPRIREVPRRGRRKRGVPHAGAAGGGSHGRFLDVWVVGADGRPQERVPPRRAVGASSSTSRRTTARRDRSRSTSRVSDARQRRLLLGRLAARRHRALRREGRGTGSGSRSTRFRSGRGSSSVHAYLGDENALALYDARSDRTFHVESRDLAGRA